MRTYYILFSLLFLCTTAQSQLYKSHDWNDDQAFFELTEDELELPSVAVKEKYLIQYYQPVLGQTFKLFETKHSIIRVNTDKGIKKHNRVYISMYNVKRVIDIKARVTLEDGSVIELKKNKIKELDNVENYGNFKIFAFEGVAKNSQLEYIYTLEKYVQSVGSVVVQTDYKIREAEVILRKPRVLSYRVKPYNGFPDMVSKKVDGKKEALTATINDIEAMTDEKSATPTANRMKMFYQVAPGFASNSEMWDRLVRNLRDNYIKIKPKRYPKLTDHYEDYVKGKSRETPNEIVNNICEYVTNNYNILRKSDSKLSELKTISREKQATPTGIIKVYTCLLNYENIDYEMVLTSNRFNHKFDRSFYSTSNLQDGLIYIKDAKRYIEPDNVNTRPHFAPTNNIGNDGIFIDKTSHRFKIIDKPRPTDNSVKRLYNIILNADDFEVTVNCKQENTGYRAKNSRGAYKYFKSRDIEEYQRNTAANGIEDAELINFEIYNEDLSYALQNTPLKFEYSYKAESLLEPASNDILVNFGKVIGNQNELYQEGERVNPIEILSPIKYDYTFRIPIPNGYEAKGLEDIKTNHRVEIDRVMACEFVSDYSIDGDTIVITVTEIYNLLTMPVKYYDGYKEVVNAAYDFSKKSILFKKTSP